MLMQQWIPLIQPADEWIYSLSPVFVGQQYFPPTLCKARPWRTQQSINGTWTSEEKNLATLDVSKLGGRERAETRRR